MSRIKLFCLPYAGGSAMVYTRWKKGLNSAVQLFPVELTGRGKRFTEPHYNTFPAAIDDVCRQILKELDGTPFALFGHSMGSLMAYEIIYQIKSLKNQTPVHAFFSGRYPPHIKKDEKILHTLPDEEFKNEILKYGGTPKEFFENPELLQIFLPVLRADYRILETHEIISRSELFDFDITVLGGTKDEEVSSEDLNEWRKCTIKQCRVYEFDGGHFFINEKTDEIVKIINETLS